MTRTTTDGLVRRSWRTGRVLQPLTPPTATYSVGIREETHLALSMLSQSLGITRRQLADDILSTFLNSAGADGARWLAENARRTQQGDVALERNNHDTIRKIFRGEPLEETGYEAQNNG